LVKTWPDKLLLFLFVVATIVGGVGIHFSINEWSAYIALVATLAGLMINVITLKPNFLQNALKLSISQAQLLVILRATSIILLLVVIILDVHIYQVVPPPSPAGLTITPTVSPTQPTLPTPSPTQPASSSPQQTEQTVCSALRAGQYDTAYAQFTERLQQHKPESEISKAYAECKPDPSVRSLTAIPVIERIYQQWVCVSAPVQSPTAIGMLTVGGLNGRTYTVDLALILDKKSWKIDCWHTIG
jgi:hypothetical protein